MANYGDLRPGLNHFRTREIGRIRNPNGTYSRQTIGENYIETKKGLIHEDKWTELAFQAVKENGDLSLLEAVEGYVKKHCLWLREGEIQQYALECVLRESYMSWNDFTKGKTK